MNNIRRIVPILKRCIKYESQHVFTKRAYVQKCSTCLIYPAPILDRQINPLALCIRNYAKGRDKKKEKGKSKVVVNESEIAEVLNVESLKIQLQKPVELMKTEFMKQLSLRNSSGSVELLNINFEGKDYTLQEIAHVVRKNPTTLVINMSVFPQAIQAVLKAVQKSGYNLNPQQEGTTIYVPIPKITQEHRENLSKTAKQLFIKCKSSVRDVQQKHIKSLKKKQDLAEDLIFDVEQQIIAMADAIIAQAETIYNTKNNELLGNN